MEETYKHIIKECRDYRTCRRYKNKRYIKNYLEDYCVNRIQKDDFEDLKNGGTYTKDEYHHFVFDNFFHQLFISKTLEGAISKNITDVKR